MILFIGQVARAFLDRGAFQELDFGRMYGQMAKWVVRVDDPGRIPELMARAFTLATSGRPGPVVIALPAAMRRAAAEADVTGARAGRWRAGAKVPTPRRAPRLGSTSRQWRASSSPCLIPVVIASQ